MDKNGSHQRSWRCFLRSLAAVLAASLAGGVFSADLTIFAAASLRGALDENVKVFSEQSSHRVRISYAGSNALARQIENGAPADMFISADDEWIDYLARKNLLVTGTRRNLVTNHLVLVAPAGSKLQLKVAPHFALAQALQGGRLALANPDAVPAGKYARAALTTLGVWPAVEHSLTRSENVRAALLLVARGEAPLGIVYATDAKAESKVRVVDTFAAHLHPPILYSGAVTARARAEAATLLAYLAGPDARAVWRRHGFGAAP